MSPVPSIDSIVRSADLLGESVLVTDSLLEAPGPSIVAVSRRFEEITGFDAAEITGQTPRVLQGPLTDRSVTRRLRESLEAGQPFLGSTINYRRDGSPFVMQWSVKPLEGDKGRVDHYLAVQRDVTDSLQAARTLDGLSVAIEQSGAYVVIADQRGRVTFTNSAYRSWASSLGARILGARLTDLPGRPPKHQLRSAQVALQHQKHWVARYETPAELDPRGPRCLALTVTRCEVGNQSSWVAIVQDETELHRLRSAARNERWRNQLEQSLATIQHEMANPLSAIKSAAQLLEIRQDGPAHDGVIDVILQQTERLELALRMLRSFSPIAEIDEEVFSVSVVFERIQRLVSEVARAQKVQLSIEEPAPSLHVRGDRDALTLSVVNLINNAIDQSVLQKTGRVWLRAEDGEVVRILVEDTAGGISEEQLHLVTQPFYTTKPHGTGLGLPIVRRLVSSMNGTLELSNHSRGGLTATITIPRGDRVVGKTGGPVEP